MDRVLSGEGDARIATAMGVSYGRVRQLVKAAFSKLGVRNRNELIALLARAIRDRS